MTAPDDAPAVRCVAAVVPVHDEQEHLGDCLDALSRAVSAARSQGLDALTVVVLDDCRDGSAALCLGRRDLHVVAGSWRRVGAARAAGCALAVRLAGDRGASPEATWLASTDADSVVPFDWLTRHVRLADRGADAVRGTVTVDDWSVWPASVATAYATGYRHDDRHDHVHGANLGVRASAYLAAGGFPPTGSHEDVALVRRLAADGARTVATTRAAVRTSARRYGRAPDGFARHLRDLADGAVVPVTLPAVAGEAT